MKAITLIALSALMCSCMQTQQSKQSQQVDSVKVKDVSVLDEEPRLEPASTIFSQVADSIFKLHPGDIKNEIIREDIAKDLKKYALQFKGKHMPLIEELPFNLTEVVKEGNKYIACFKYDKEGDEKNLGLEMQLSVSQSREDAAKLYEGKNYMIKGIMAGFPYADLMPCALEPLYSYSRPLLSLGVIKIDNAELTMK